MIWGNRPSITNTDGEFRMIVSIFGAVTGALASADVSRGGKTEEQSESYPTVRTRDERIIHLLEKRDGYTWQGDIVTELPCSKSTTSRELSELENAGRIIRYRIGRENVVCLPHEEPESLKSNHSNQQGIDSGQEVSPAPAPH